ncbi:MAG: hypothetical protein ACREP9_21285, partial [Candidatus Dormibacteraceae bacterium]
MRVRVWPARCGAWLGIVTLLTGVFLLCAAGAVTVRAAAPGTTQNRLYRGVDAGSAQLTQANLMAVEMTSGKPDFWVRRLDQLNQKSNENQVALRNNVNLLLTWCSTTSTDSEQAGSDQAQAAISRFSYFADPAKRPVALFLEERGRGCPNAPQSQAFLSGWYNG